MARQWTCGFESQTLTAGQEVEVVNGSPAISSAVKDAGAASMRCNPTAAVSGIAQTIYSAADPAAHILMRAYIRVDTAPSAVVGIMSWADNTTGTSSFIGLRMNTNRTLIGGGSSVTTGTASAALNIGQWYRVETDYNDSTDTLGCYLDGVLWTTVSAVDLAGGNIARFGLLQAVTADIYYDDCAVNDASGSAQTGLPGAGSVVHLRPNSAGDNNGFATAVGGSAGAANNFTRVNEVTPDDATSYNETTATGTTTTDDFGCVDSAAAGINGGDAVTLVQVGCRVGSNAVTTASLVTRIKSQASGTVLESASIPVNVNGWTTNTTTLPKTPKLTSYTDPQAGGVWTPALLDSMQIGYRSNVSQTTSRRVSALWATVEYVPTVKKLSALGVG